MKKKIWIFLLSLFFCACATPSDRIAVSPELKIGTASTDGVYYKVGTALADIATKAQATYTFKAYPSQGSVSNIEAILNGDITFGIVQSDRLYQAFHGKDYWAAKGPQTNLKSIGALFPETVLLVASASSNIQKVSDLKNKHVNLGAIGSGEYQNAMDILAAANIHPQTDMRMELFSAGENASLMKEEVLDAYFLTTALPSDIVKNSSKRKDPARILPLDASLIDALVKKYPYYTKATALSTDKGATAVSTIGVMAILATSDLVSNEVAYAMAKSLVENFARLEKIHPAFQGQTPKDLIQNLPIPLHPGAKRYYEEAGLLSK